MTGDKKLKRTSIIIAAILLALAGYLLIARVPGQSSGTPEKVTIAHSTLPYAALAQIAQVRDLYGKEGLAATPLFFSYGKPALEAVIAGKADFATVAETPIMLAILNGAPLSIIATIQVSKKSHAIVARLDRGITRPDQLRGHRIGTTQGTSGHFYLDAYLLAQGMGLHQVQMVNTKPDDMASSLARGEVDAVSAWEPFLNQAQKAVGRMGRTFADDEIYTLTFNLVTTQEYAAKNPGRVEKMLRSLVAAEEFARADPKEAQRIVAEFDKMELETVASMWGSTTFRVTLDQALLLVLEDEAGWAIRNNMTAAREIPNFIEYIDLNALESVKPKAVGIVR